jgi:hypothetical protein
MKEILAKDKQKQLVFLCLEDVCFLIKRIVIFCINNIVLLELG